MISLLEALFGTVARGITFLCKLFQPMDPVATRTPQVIGIVRQEPSWAGISYRQGLLSFVLEHEKLDQNARCHPMTLLHESSSLRSSCHIVGLIWLKADALRSIVVATEEKEGSQLTSQGGKVRANQFGSSSQKVDWLGPFLPMRRRCDQLW